MTDFTALIRLLSENEVEFIIVGGAAATAHGSARLTLDLDVVYNRSPRNLELLVNALRPVQPYFEARHPDYHSNRVLRRFKKASTSR